MNTLDRIEKLAGDKTTLQLRLGETIMAINEIAQICEAVRYQNGLGKHQWDRVVKARSVAKDAELALEKVRAALSEGA